MRINSIDILRGFALLGILLMNIVSFAMPDSAYFNPNAYAGSVETNQYVYALMHTFADQKFMALFSILFGASVMLLIQKFREKGQRPLVKHLIRNSWLFLFGFLHGVYLWAGDILMVYAILSFALYFFHPLPSKWQFGLGLFIFLIPSVFCLLVQSELGNLDAISQKTIAQYWQPPVSAISQDLRLFRSENTLQQLQRITDANYPDNDGQDLIDASVLLDVFARAFGMMLIGMALFRWGVLTAQRDDQFYWRLLKIGLAVGLPLTAFGLGLLIYYSWDWHYAMFIGRIPNHLATPFIALAYMAMIMLWSKSEFLSGLQKKIAAVGRMALSNYIGQTLIAIFIFYGVGLGYYGELNRLALLLVVILFWCIQIISSSWWMNNFHYGPLEWLWRCLTQFSLPPLVKRRF